MATEYLVWNRPILSLSVIVTLSCIRSCVPIQIKFSISLFCFFVCFFCFLYLLYFSFERTRCFVSLLGCHSLWYPCSPIQSWVITHNHDSFASGRRFLLLVQKLLIDLFRKLTEISSEVTASSKSSLSCYEPIGQRMCWCTQLLLRFQRIDDVSCRKWKTYQAHNSLNP